MASQVRQWYCPGYGSPQDKQPKTTYWREYEAELGYGLKDPQNVARQRLEDENTRSKSNGSRSLMRLLSLQALRIVVSSYKELPIVLSFTHDYRIQSCQGRQGVCIDSDMPQHVDIGLGFACPSGDFAVDIPTIVFPSTK